MQKTLQIANLSLTKQAFQWPATAPYREDNQEPVIFGFHETETSPETKLAAVKTSFKIRLADCKADIRAAQKLRYDIFSKEFSLPHNDRGVDTDEFDAYCHHLIVEDLVSKKIVGTYRMLNAYGAKRCGKYYGQSEFSGSLWQTMGDNMVELGRACIHPDFRSGTVLMKLWQGIMDYLGVLSVRYAIGYASVGVRHGDADVIATQAYLATDSRPWTGPQLKPKLAFQAKIFSALGSSPILGEAPALIKGYVRLGAFCIGEPAWDKQFQTADFPMLLDMTQLDKRYAKHFKVGAYLSNLN